MNYKLQKTYVQIVGPHSPGSFSDWKNVEVEVTFDYGEKDYCAYSERFLLSAHRSTYDRGVSWTSTMLSEPEWRHIGDGSRQQKMEQALKYLKAFNKYLASLPVRITTLPDLLNALLVFYKVKTVSYAYYPHSKSGSTDHQKDSYPGRVVRVVHDHWQKLLDLPSKQEESEAA